MSIKIIATWRRVLNQHKTPEAIFIYHSFTSCKESASAYALFIRSTKHAPPWLKGWLLVKRRCPFNQAWYKEDDLNRKLPLSKGLWCRSNLAMHFILHSSSRLLWPMRIHYWRSKPTAHLCKSVKYQHFSNSYLLLSLSGCVDYNTPLGDTECTLDYRASEDKYTDILAAVPKFRVRDQRERPPQMQH